MKKTQSLPLAAYEEDRMIQKQIEKILSADSSNRWKEKQLKELQTSVTSNLASSHIAYFQNLFRKKRHAVYHRLLSLTLILFFLAWTVHRSIYFLYPGTPPYDLIGLSQEQQILFICLIPVFFLSYYLIQYITAYFHAKNTRQDD